MESDIKDGSAITVYGASSEKIAQAFKDAAYEVGKLIAGAGRPLVCGGGRLGLMRAAIEGVVDAGGVAIGVLPSFMIMKQWQHPALTTVIETETMHIRKETMARLSMAAIACPGGCGTFEELLEIITWRQLGLYKGNVVILNTDGYYDPLLAMFRRAEDEGFMREGRSSSLFRVAETPRQAVDYALGNITD